MRELMSISIFILNICLKLCFVDSKNVSTRAMGSNMKFPTSRRSRNTFESSNFEFKRRKDDFGVCLASLILSGKGRSAPRILARPVCLV